MKSLQNKLNLIKEGKGNKELFLKEARAMFPNVVTGALTFDQAVHNLTERGILSEGFIGLSSQTSTQPNWFEIFNENVKADLKKPDTEVEKMETKGYDYKDEKNSNNLSMESILSGYYTELKDPKNAEKTEEELKEMVTKNLTKDPLHYMKDGAFGVKGIGYTDKAPGLGATKEVTGKYKSSGMEPVKLTESKSKIKVGDIILNEGYNEDKIAKYKEYTYTLGGKKVIPDDIDFYGHVLGIEIDGEVYRPGTPDEKGNIELKPRKGKTGMYTESKHSGEADLKIYKSELNMLNKIKATGEKHEKRKADLEKKIADLEKKMTEVFYGSSDGDYEHDMEQEVRANEYYDKGLQAYTEGDMLKAEKYYAAALKAGSWLGWTEYDLPHYEKATKGSLGEYDQNWDGSLDYLQYMDDQPMDAHDRKAMKMFGKPYDELDEYEKDRVQAELDHDSNPDYFQEGLQLTEAKNKAMEKAVKEIEKKSELAKAEAKIQEIEALISELESKLTMTEADGVSEMVDKKKVKEIQSNIKFLEARKKKYHKEKSRMESKVGSKKKMLDEKEAVDYNTEDDLMHAQAHRGLKRSVSQPVKPWSEIVKGILASKGLKK